MRAARKHLPQTPRNPGIALLVDAMHNGGERLSFLPSEHAAVRRLLSLTGLDQRMALEPAAIVPAAAAADTDTLQPAA